MHRISMTSFWVFCHRREIVPETRFGMTPAGSGHWRQVWNSTQITRHPRTQGNLCNLKNHHWSILVAISGRRCLLVCQNLSSMPDTLSRKSGSTTHYIHSSTLVPKSAHQYHVYAPSPRIQVYHSSSLLTRGLAQMAEAQERKRKNGWNVYIRGSLNTRNRTMPLNWFPEKTPLVVKFIHWHLLNKRHWTHSLRKTWRPVRSSLVLFIKKEDSFLCLVQDYWSLNTITVKNKYPLLSISKLVNKLWGAQYFTKLNVQWGFNNVRMKDGDEWKAAFHTNCGLFEPLLMFFGPTNSPATFQTMMDSIFKGLISEGKVIVYLDDILIFIETLEEHHVISSTIPHLILFSSYLVLLMPWWHHCLPPFTLLCI